LQYKRSPLVNGPGGVARGVKLGPLGPGEIRSSGIAVTFVVHEHKRLGRGIEPAMLAEDAAQQSAAARNRTAAAHVSRTMISTEHQEHAISTRLVSPSAVSVDPPKVNDYNSFAEAYTAANETNLVNAYYERPAMLPSLETWPAGGSSTRAAARGPCLPPCATVAPL
jgi:hypothetical protein